MNPKPTTMLTGLVATLSEIYQPIYGHPKLSTTVSRNCDDRLNEIRQAYLALERCVGHPLRVLDLGCAQGYISLNLAAMGATVTGVDYQSTNVAVCRALAAEHPQLKVQFEENTIDSVLEGVVPGDYDLVLGLSVFHHIVHEHGTETVSGWLTVLAKKVEAAIFELALASEPLYWAEAQPEDERSLLVGFAFVHELTRYPTHLSEVMRPLFFVSNRYWYFDEEASAFSSWKDVSHPLAGAVHQGTRRYYKSEETIAKLFRLQGKLAGPNRNEIEQESTFLSKIPVGFSPAPKLYASGVNECEAWLVRAVLPGDLLIELMQANRPYDERRVIRDVLKQLTVLEAVGLYHNDVRVWNVLVGPVGEAVLIDYGSISTTREDCVWPRDPVLAFWIFVWEVVAGVLPRISPQRQPFISPYSLPTSYQHWAMAVWGHPAREWSFRLLLDLFDHPGNTIVKLEGVSGFTLWMSAIEQHLNTIGAHVQHIEEKADGQAHCTNQIDAEFTLHRAAMSVQAENLHALFNFAQALVKSLEGDLVQVVVCEQELGAQVTQGQAEVLRLTARLATREQELGAQMMQGQAEVLRLNQALATREQELGVQMTQGQAEVLRLTQTLATREQDIVRLEGELAQRDAIVDGLRLEGDGLRLELQAVYATCSWRYSEPLRKAKFFSKELVYMIKFRLSTLSSLPRRVVRRALRSVFAHMQAHPERKAKVVSLLANFPKLDEKLHAIARANRHTGLVLSATRDQVSAIAPPHELLQIGPDFQASSSSPLVFQLNSGNRFIYFYVDHTILCPVNTGMQRVTRSLARALREHGEQVRFVKWDASHQKIILVNHEELACLSQWHGPALSEEELRFYPSSQAELIAVGTHAIEEGHWLVVPEVTYINYHSQPVTLEVIMAAKQLSLKTAFVFYDAIPLRRTEFAAVAPDHEAYMQQLLLADLVLPISDWSARDLKSFFDMHEGKTLSLPKVAAITLPGESQFVSRVTIPATLGEQRKLILSVGTIETRKNQVALVHAFEKFCADHSNNAWHLSLVGNLHPKVMSEINLAVKRNSRISYLGNIQDNELDALYRLSVFTVFPSVDEGFGLPILESLWYAKPCICANFGAMKEVAEGGGCLMVDVRQMGELVRGITRMTTEPGLLEQLTHEAVNRSITTWADYAKGFIKQIEHEHDPINQLGVIYYWVDHTCTYPFNSGIQRVVRGLARALLAIGLKLIPVKWDRAKNQLYAPSDKELKLLALWNGPEPSAWAPWVDPSQSSVNDWILIPELTTYLEDNFLFNLKQFASLYGLRVGWIFYDAIPLKMRDIYPPEATYAHCRYMEGLNQFEKVFAISEHSRCDLTQFLEAKRIKTPYLDDRIQACLLPGEFLEASRVTSSKKKSTDVIKILCVCTVEPRKNHLSLLEAFVKVRGQMERQVELVLVGGSLFIDLAKKVQQYIKSTPDIRWEQNPNDTRLCELYAECDFTVYPSLEEGFGLPILESLWNARPCICRNSGSMAEVAKGGGCLTVETADVTALAEAMVRLIVDDELRLELAHEAITRSFKTWKDYAREVATRMATERRIFSLQSPPDPQDKSDFYDTFVNLRHRPLLSLCITTYNRAEWLELSLKNLIQLIPNPRVEIEIVVCDNTSTDQTPDVVKPYLARTDFRYYRNPKNVGMLGNLRVTAHHASGQYIWILGDDDLVKPGTIERVLQVIRDNPETALVYLNYAYTNQDDPNAVMDLEIFLDECTPIVTPGPDIKGPVHKISTQSENFFTAIYCLVFRRDHALRAYSQNTGGRPFSTMLTCIPTTYYVLNFMMNEPAYWMGSPQLVVNMNVSWLKYAPIWILERLPEAHDLAEKMGANPQEVDRCRMNHLPHLMHWFREIFENDTESNVEYFSASRLISRMKHLDGFKNDIEALRNIYHTNHLHGRPGANVPTSQVFAAFENRE